MPEVFLRTGVLLLDDLSGEGRAALARFRLDELEKLLAGEIAGMRGHKVKEAGFFFRVAEISERLAANRCALAGQRGIGLQVLPISKNSARAAGGHFVLRNQGFTYLETEEQKLAFFCDQLGIDKKILPTNGIPALSKATSRTTISWINSRCSTIQMLLSLLW